MIDDSLLLYKIIKNRTGAEISASGNPAIMSDTLKNNPMNEMKVFGWSKQQTTTGKNLLTEHVGNSVNNTWCATSGVNLIAGTTYVFSVGCKCAGLYAIKLGETNASKIVYDVNTMVFTPEETGLYWFKAYKTEAFTTTGQLEVGTEATDYEPYTGGQPSPSPDYPQEIVSAGMKWSAGKNLLNYERLAETSPLLYKVENSMLTVLNGDGRSWDSVQGTLVLKAGTYRTSGDTVEIFKASDNSAISFNHTPFTLAEDTEVKIKVGADRTVFPYISKAMIEAGTETTNYEPYDGGVPKLYGDKVNVEVRGKNWLHITPFSTKIQNGVTFEYVKPGGIKVTGTATANTDSPVFPIELEPGYYYANKTMKNQSVVVERNGKNIWLNGRVFAILQDDVPKYWYFVILKGDTVNATIYQRIHKKEEVPQSLSISTPTGLPAIPVDSDGNYTDADGQQWIADYVDLKRGKYVQNICDLPLKDISLEWNTWGVNVIASNSTGFFAYVNKYAHVGNTKALATICRHHTDAWGGRKVGCSANVNNSYITISLYTSDLDDASDNTKAIESFKKIVEQTDTHVLYVRAEPIERDLTPEEIQAYQNLVTYAGTTTVENDAECYMEVSAGGGDSLRAKKLALILEE